MNEPRQDRSFEQRVSRLAGKCRVEICEAEEISVPPWWDEPLADSEILKHWQFCAMGGECHLYWTPKKAVVFWRSRCITFREKDYGEGLMEEAVLDCLDSIFSGGSGRDPEPSPFPYGCVLTGVFPFLHLLGGEYRKTKKRRST